ncbi:MAG: cobyrinate a,c-diamide synthase [Geminocystis sp.]|nr:cobyrinate a,c-diamide synthase [Geminocystis sp.]HIK38131.1 cobyrinate a,c-diamide synthase [Geminocystis sp. M7585_C2015_104]MCS7147400.1 cobyrinate a,c-diamide synthase [Geminocystis sp.]MCX8079364.1 cobyrinate a,c-diamide synthase [Geminocystis sp.]MDW8117089.1 cobyrinate a,c-diamide synthase [Geminocystis sp.]
MAFIIAGERSGVGKTTVTLAILSYLKNQGKSIQSFKVGPDYIDPMFHTAITKRPCRNLDPILTSPDYTRWCYEYHCRGVEVAVVEGVMGLFDGIPHEDYFAYGSTAHIARLLDLPVILVIDCSRLSVSIAAIIVGYTSLDRGVKIAGVILNQVASEKHLSLLKAGLAVTGIPLMGVWFRDESIALQSRHLGLIPVEEIPQQQSFFTRLATLAAKNIYWQQLTPYLQPPTSTSRQYFLPFSERKFPLKIAIARDKSFNFYYQDNLDIFQHLGVELLTFSPLKDNRLPEGVSGLYLGGGFPEVFAEELAENWRLKESIKRAIDGGMPTYAECGGMMYLAREIEDFEGKKWPMVAIFPHRVKMTKKLTLGYRKVITLKDTPMFSQNTILVGHEFHRAVDEETPKNPLWEFRDYYTGKLLSYQGWYNPSRQVYASYLHLHFANNLREVTKFVQLCLFYWHSKKA